MRKTFPDGSRWNMTNLEQLAEEIQAQIKRERKRCRESDRASMLVGLSRDKQIELIVGHIRFRGRQYSPREWYR